MNSRVDEQKVQMLGAITGRCPRLLEELHSGGALLLRRADLVRR